MSKLNRANNTGSYSIILPKTDVEQLGWEVGDEIQVLLCGNKFVVQNVRTIIDGIREEIDDKTN